MERLFLIITLTASIASSFGQGSVAFSPSTLYRLSIDRVGYAEQVPLTPGLMNYGLFYGAGATQPASLTFLSSQLGVNSTTGAGRIADPADGTSLLNNVWLPGTTVAESDVWVQVRAWSASFGSDWAAAKAAFHSLQYGVYYGESETRNVNPLGSPAISGVTIWQAATGTNPKLIPVFVIPMSVPEPASLTLIGFGAVALICHRRK